MKVLVATEKPFAAAAVEGIKKEIEGAGNELVLLEKYTEKQQLLDAVKDADAMIIRSDKVDAEVLDAARYYADKSGRRVSIEYALIRDINDQGWRADMLGKKLHKALGSRVHVNLIPLNPTPGSKWDASPKAQQDEFVRRVRAQGVPCTVRDTRGNEIAAACGQLAAEGA